MIRRTKIERRTPVKKSRGARRGPWRSERYRRWVASQPCLICAHPDTQAAHTINGGMSMKGPDSSCVPLCYSHHLEYDAGRARFDQKYGTDLYRVSTHLWAIWQAKQGKVAA